MKALLRIVIGLLLFGSVAHGLWFVALPLSIFGLSIFSTYVEVIIAGIVYDSLFGFAPGLGIYGYAGTIVALCVFILSVVIKKTTRE